MIDRAMRRHISGNPFRQYNTYAGWEGNNSTLSLDTFVGIHCYAWSANGRQNCGVPNNECAPSARPSAPDCPDNGDNRLLPG